MSKGVVQIYYGEGHGKSMAASGSAMRCISEGRQASVIQFLKGENEQEQNLFSRLEPEIKYFNFARAGIRFEELDEEKKMEEIMNLKNGFNYGKKVISTGACDLVVLDEILGLVDLKVLTFDDIREMIESKPEDMTIIMTGRVMDDRLRELADEIYHISPEK